MGSIPAARVRRWVEYCRDTDDKATAPIASLKFEQSYAGKTRITDRSLEILSRMTTLETLVFRAKAGISDAGVARTREAAALRRSRSSARRGSREGVAVSAAGFRA